MFRICVVFDCFVALNLHGLFCLIFGLRYFVGVCLLVLALYCVLELCFIDYFAGVVALRTFTWVGCLIVRLGELLL